MTYNSIDGFNMALIMGDDAGAGAGLTAWRNADAQYILGECIPSDVCLGWSDTPPVRESKRHGPMSTTRVKQRYSANTKPGVWKSQHALQSLQFLFWLMQTPGTPTTEGTPASYNTQLLTIATSSIPLWNGIHYETESITSSELYYDIMGILPYELVISVGQDIASYKATQEISCAYANRIAGTSLTPQTLRPAMTVGTLWKNYENLVTGNGIGLNPTTLKYNSLSLEVDVIGARFKFKRDYSFGPPVSKIMSSGFLHGFDFTIELDVIPVGDALYDLNVVEKEDYVGDGIDYTPVFNADSTNDKITFDYNAMYLVPFDVKNDFKSWFQGYTITLEPYDYNSVFTGTGIGGLDNTHIENP